MERRPDRALEGTARPRTRTARQGRPRVKAVSAAVFLVTVTLAACGEGVGLLAVSVDQDMVSAYVGDSVVTVFEVRNEGEGDFTFVEFVFTETPAIEAGPQFQITPYLREQVIEPGGALQFELKFEPLEVGEARCDILISTSVGRETVSVVGQGVNNPPAVVFTADNPETVCAGTTFALEASVSDVEDQADLTVIDALLSSDVEGDLVAGHPQADGTFRADVTLEVEGPQTLTLTVTDSHGDTGVAAMAVDVRLAGEEQGGAVACEAPAAGD